VAGLPAVLAHGFCLESEVVASMNSLILDMNNSRKTSSKKLIPREGWIKKRNFGCFEPGQ
jgi:hypothetical protein